MYCPKCEFEIKQDVTECPICGGELTEHPEDGTGPDTAGSGTESPIAETGKPIDTCISDLILDAKHELDSLDTKPDSGEQPVQPASSSLDFESLLSKDSAEAAPPAAEPPLSSTVPDTAGAHEETLSLDDSAGPSLESDIFAADEPSFGQNEPPDNLFSNDKLFIDEAAPAEGTPDTGPLIEEPGSGQPEAPPEYETPPSPEPSSEEPWSLQELSNLEPANFIPETQAEQPSAVPENKADFLNIDETETAETAQEQIPGNAAPRSKKRLVFIMLFGVLLIVGAYALSNFLPQDFDLTQTKENILGRLPAWVPGAAPQEPTPAAKPKPRIAPKLPQKEAPEPAQPLQPELQAPAEIARETAEPFDAPAAVPQQVPAPQTETRVPAELVPTAKSPAPEPTAAVPAGIETAVGETGQQPSIAAEEKPGVAESEPAKTTPETGITPEKKKPPVQANYTIHVASFKDQNIAQKEVEQLRAHGFDAYLEIADLGAKGVWNRVKVGHFATRADAEQTVKKIRQKNPTVKPLIYKNK